MKIPSQFKMERNEIEKNLLAMTNQLLAESGEPYKRELKLDMSLQRHLGIDSLTRAELFQRVEKQFGVRLPDRLLAEVETLADIVAFLEKAEGNVQPQAPTKIIASHGEFSHANPGKAESLLEVLQLHVESAPQKPHIYFQNEEGQEEVITYSELYQRALQVAHSLRELGLKEGETVAIMLPTHPGFFYTFLGTLLAGGIPVPIYPPFRMHMLETYSRTEARILSNAEVRILVTFEQAETLSRLLQGFVPSLKTVTTVAQLLQPDSLHSPFKAKSDSFAFIQYTSGSTADPKGVLLTHYNLLSNIRAYGKAIKVTPNDVAVSWLPLYHDMGLIGMWLGSLYFGIPLILLTPFAFLNHPERWLWAIHYHRGTLSGAPNFAYELCVRKIDAALTEGLDLSSWRVAANGAEKVYPRTLELFSQKFAPYGFKRSTMMPVYGLAESSVALAIPPVGRDFRIDYVDRKAFEEKREAVITTDKGALAFASCGGPLEGHDIRIVGDDASTPLPERHVGSLQFRGPSSMQGYYNNPRATQAIFHDGWIDSGDLAYQADGELYVTGRRKDLIIKAGRNLYPAEIEELVGNVAGVRQGCVAAFGLTDTKRGTEQLIVVAETREKNKAEREAIVNGINDVISTTLDIVPDHVVLVKPHLVPKTSSGKLQRAACKTKYIEGKLGKGQLPPWMQVAKLGSGWLMRKILKGIVTLGKLLYSAYAMLLFVVTLLPIYVIVKFSSPSVAAKVTRAWTRFLLKVACWPIHIAGEEKLTQATPVIYTPNHASYVDALVMMAILPLNTRLIGKKELFNVPIIRTFMRKLGYLGIDRFDMPKGIEDTKLIEDVLKDGHSIMIFPEGTFGYSAGLRPFRLGAFKLAAETQLPICPIAMQGTRPILRSGEMLLRPNSIHITVCDLVKAKGQEWQDVTELRQAVRMEIVKYCGEPSLDFIAAQTVAVKPNR